MAKANATKQDTIKKDTAVTFRLEPELIKKMKFVAFTDETTQTAIVDQALKDYFAKWEKKNGPIIK